MNRQLLNMGDYFNRNRKTLQTASIWTMGIAGLLWVVYQVEPFASKMERFKYRGGGVPTVPKTGTEAGTAVTHPKSA